MRARRPAVLIALAAMVLPFAIGGPAQAAGPPSTSTAQAVATSDRTPGKALYIGHPVRHDATSRSVDGYWTPQRMREAEPLDVLRVRPGQSGPAARGGQAGPTGDPLYVAGTAPAAGERHGTTNARPRATGQKWKGGGRVVKTTGRIFSRINGRNSSCSAAVVAGRRKDFLATAGHCLYYKKHWARNVVFVPGYRNNRAPLGVWDAKQIWVTKQWHRKPFAGPPKSYKYDVGFIALKKHKGLQIAERVGAQGIAFNTRGNPRVFAFGYPAMFQYDGMSLRYCAGKSSRDRYERSNYRVKCTMNGGASGGPWLTRFNPRTGVGYQIGVNSYIVGGHRNGRAVGAPAFNDVIKRIYQRLQKRG